MKLDVLELDKGGYLVKTGTKEFKPADAPLSKWIKRPDTQRGAVKEVRPPMNGWQIYTGKPRLDKWVKGAVGYLIFISNDMQQSKLVFLTSGPNQAGCGWSILPENFQQSMVAMAARKLPRHTWLNDCDQFDTPNTEHPEYAQFALDAVIYSLFHGSNTTSSLGEVEYNGETYDIPNHFFWMTRQEVMDSQIPQPLYNKARRDKERFVATWLKEHEGQFSKDAQSVLNIATNLVKVAGPYRTSADPEYQLADRWDAGWYQIRNGICKDDVPFKKPGDVEYLADIFKSTYKELQNRLRPLVYELGFLPKEESLADIDAKAAGRQALANELVESLHDLEELDGQF